MIPADTVLEARVLGAAMANCADGEALVPLMRRDEAWWWPAHARLAAWLAEQHDDNGAVPHATLVPLLLSSELDHRWRWAIFGAPEALAPDIDRCRAVATPALVRDALAVIDLSERRRIMRAANAAYNVATEVYQAAADLHVPLGADPWHLHGETKPDPLVPISEALSHLLDELGLAA